MRKIKLFCKMLYNLVSAASEDPEHYGLPLHHENSKTSQRLRTEHTEPALIHQTPYLTDPLL